MRTPKYAADKTVGEKNGIRTLKPSKLKPLPCFFNFRPENKKMGLDPKTQPLKFTMYTDYHIAIPYAMISTYIKHS